MKRMTLRELNDAVRSGQVEMRPIEQRDASSLEKLHNSVSRVSDSENAIYRCEACRSIQNPRVVEKEKRSDGINTITEACQQLWGPAYVPVNFAHDLDGSLVGPAQIELMLVGFAPGGATNESQSSNIDLLDIHSVPLGLKWAEYGASGARVNRSNIEYILNLINEGIGQRDYFEIGRNVHLTNILKCRSYRNSISPFRQEARMCYDRYLEKEIALLPNLKAIVMFMQKQNFPPLIQRTDVYGTFRCGEGTPVYAYMWHFANPGFNAQRSSGKYESFCPMLGREIRERF